MPVVPDDSVVYLYGIVPGGQPLPDRAGATTADVALPSVVAIADLLPAGDFSGPALEAHLRDFSWVSARAQLHTAVLGQAMERGPVVPAHLCTLFSSQAALRDFLDRNEGHLRAALERVRGRREWGLKVYFDEARVRARCIALEPRLSGVLATGAAPGSGAAWMLQKRRDAELAERVAERLDQAGDAVFGEVAIAAVDVRVRPVLSEAASGAPAPMLLNAALLVDTGGESALHATVDRLAGELEHEGYELVLSGPWPPFTFSEEAPA